MILHFLVWGYLKTINPMKVYNRENNVLIKSAKIIDPENGLNNKVRDVYLENGVIKDISPKIDDVNNSKIIHKSNLHLSPGWFDFWVDFDYPGMENRETIETGVLSAAKGGFTNVAINPKTNPVIDDGFMVKLILEKTNSDIVNISVIGALTKGAKGEALADIYDMNKNGAIAFSDGKLSNMKADTLSIALDYAKGIEGLIMSFPSEYSLSKNGQVNEGKISLMNGLKGIPNISETVNVFRDISICEYNKSKLHLSSISSKESIHLINQAKDKNLDITCHVTPYHLFFDEEDLLDFDTYKKVFPPIRTQQDRDALKNAIKEGVIDFVSSEHTPVLIEDKICPFENASFGTIGLESYFGAVNKSLKGVCELDYIIDIIAIKPRKRFKIDVPKVEVGQKAEITLFDPSISWTFSKEHIGSKSPNSIFLGQELLGKPIGVFNNNKLFLNE